jgi:hypothetical protein
LFDDDEKPQIRKSPPSETLDIDLSEIERRAMAAVGVAV